VLQDRQHELEKKIADFDTEFVQQQLALAKTLTEDAHAQEQKIGEVYDKEFAKVQSLSDQDSQYAFLKSECDMMEKLCNSLLGQTNQLDLSARLEGLKIYVLQKAMPAEKPSSPQAVKVIGIALVLGLMVGAGLSLLRDWRDQRVRSPDEITAIDSSTIAQTRAEAAVCLELPGIGGVPGHPYIAVVWRTSGPDKNDPGDVAGAPGGQDPAGKQPRHGDGASRTEDAHCGCRSA
jgi:hypothetical protein